MTNSPTNEVERLHGWLAGTFAYTAYRGRAPDGVPQLRSDIRIVLDASQARAIPVVDGRDAVAWQWRSKGHSERDKWSEWQHGTGDKSSYVYPHADYEFRDLGVLPAPSTQRTAGETSELDAAGIEAARIAYLEAEENPKMVECAHCNGRGYNHGYGEDGADTDWCSHCGGGKYDLAEGEQHRPLDEAIRAYLAALASPPHGRSAPLVDWEGCPVDEKAMRELMYKPAPSPISGEATDAMVDAALNAWFEQPDREDDMSLERGLRAALNAALATQPTTQPEGDGR